MLWRVRMIEINYIKDDSFFTIPNKQDFEFSFKCSQFASELYFAMNEVNDKVDHPDKSFFFIKNEKFEKIATNGKKTRLKYFLEEHI